MNGGIEMLYQERRDEHGRRLTQDRRQNGQSMISNYAQFSGRERRSGEDRRMGNDRRD
ncbi:MAG: hypothetical protein ACE5GZ_02580 [Gammaproteobacteria bacterium]